MVSEVNTDLLGFFVGGLFGAALLLSGLALPDKIIGTLRLKDFHAFRVIGVFLIVGMLGVWFLDMAGIAHFSIKGANLLSNLIGGALLGIGFGLTGYCPGTGLAAAATGRLDALVTVVGMFFGALAFIFLYPVIMERIEPLYNYGKVTLDDVTVVPRAVWVWGLVVVGTLLLWLTRPRHAPAPKPYETGEHPGQTAAVPPVEQPVQTSLTPPMELTVEEKPLPQEPLAQEFEQEMPEDEKPFGPDETEEPLM